MAFKLPMPVKKIQNDYSRLFSNMTEEQKAVAAYLKDEIDGTFKNVLGAAREMLRRFCANHTSPNHLEVLARVIESEHNFAALEQKQNNQNKFFMWVNRRDGKGAFLGIYVLLSLSRTPLIRYFSWIIDPQAGEIYRKDPFALEEDVMKGKYGGTGFMMFYPFFHELTHVSNLHILVNEEVAAYIMRLFDESIKNKADLLPPAFAPYSIFDDNLDPQQEVVSTIVQNRILKYKINLLYLPNLYVRYLLETEANIGGLLSTMLVYFYYIYVMRKLLVFDINDKQEYEKFYNDLALLLAKFNDNPQDRYQLYLHFLSFINNYILNHHDFVSFVENYLEMYINTFRSTLEHLLGKNYIGSGSVDRFTFGIYNVMYNFIDSLSRSFSKNDSGKGMKIVETINKLIANDLAYYTYKYAKNIHKDIVKTHNPDNAEAKKIQNTLESSLRAAFTSFVETEPANITLPKNANVETLYNKTMYEVFNMFISDAIKDIQGLKEYSEGWKRTSSPVFNTWKTTAENYSNIYNSILFEADKIDTIDDYLEWLKNIKDLASNIQNIASESKVTLKFKLDSDIKAIETLIKKIKKEREKSKDVSGETYTELNKMVQNLKKKAAQQYIAFINNLDLDQNIKDAIIMALAGIESLDQKKDEDGFTIAYNLGNSESYEQFVEHVFHLLAVIAAERGGARAPELLNKYMSILLRHPLFNKVLGSFTRQEGSILHYTTNVFESINSYLESQYELFDRISKYLEETMKSIKKDYILTQDIIFSGKSYSGQIDISLSLTMDHILNRKAIEKSSMSLLALHNENINKLLRESESSSQKYYSIDHRLMSYLFYTNITDFTIVVEDLIYAFDIVSSVSYTLFERVNKVMKGKDREKRPFQAFAFSLSAYKSKYGNSPFGSGIEEQEGGGEDDDDRERPYDPGGDPGHGKPRRKPIDDNRGGGGGGEDDDDREGPQGPRGEPVQKSPKSGHGNLPVINQDDWEKEKQRAEEEYNKDITVEERDILRRKDDDEPLIYKPNLPQPPERNRRRDIYKKYRDERMQRVVSGLPEGLKITYKGVSAAVSSASYLLYKIMLENYYGFVNNNIKAEEGYLYSGFGSSSSEKSYIDPSTVPSQMESSPDPSIIPVSAVIKRDFEPEYTLVTADYISIDVSGSMHGYIERAVSAGKEPHLKNTALETFIKELFIHVSKEGLLDVKKIRDLLVNNDNESARLLSNYLSNFAASFDAERLNMLVEIVYSTFAFAFYMDPSRVLSSRFFRNANFASVINDAEPRTTLVSVTALASEEEMYFPSLTLLVDKGTPNTIEKITYASNHLSGGNDPAYNVGYAWGKTVIKDIILSTLLHYHHNEEKLPNKKIDLALNLIHITDLYYEQDSHFRGFIDAITSIKSAGFLDRILSEIAHADALMNSEITHLHGVVTPQAPNDMKIMTQVSEFSNRFVINYEIDNDIFSICIYTRSDNHEYIKFGIHFNNFGVFSYGDKSEAINMMRSETNGNVIRYVASKIINTLKDERTGTRQYPNLGSLAVYNAYRMLPKSLSVMSVDQSSVLKAALAIILLAYITIKQNEAEKQDFAFTEEEMQNITITVESYKNVIAKILTNRILRKDMGVRMSSDVEFNLSGDNPAMYHASFEDFKAWTGLDSLPNPLEDAPDKLIGYDTGNRSDVIEEEVASAIEKPMRSSIEKQAISATINVIPTVPIALHKTRNQRT